MDQWCFDYARQENMSELNGISTLNYLCICLQLHDAMLGSPSFTA